MNTRFLIYYTFWMLGVYPLGNAIAERPKDWRLYVSLVGALGSAVEQFEKHNIEYTLKNEQTGHFHCRRKRDGKLLQFYAGTGKIMGCSTLRGINSFIRLLTEGVNDG